MNLKLCTCAWKPGHAETFRNKSAMLFGRIGTNMQNLPPRISAMFVPPPRKKFVQTDQAGAEALIVSYLGRAGNLRKLFEHNIKPHSYVAMHIFKHYWAKQGHRVVYAATETPIESLQFLKGWAELYKAIKNHDQYYYIGKKTCHSANYDEGVNTFRMTVLEESEGAIVLSLKDATLFMETYHKIFPEVREWQRETKERVRTTRTLRNLFGYPREFYGPLNDRLYKKAYAWVPQSTVGCLANIAFCEEQTYIESNKLNWDIINNKHDSTLTQCPEEEVEECIKIKRQIVEKEFTYRGTKFRMKSEASVGRNWGKYHPTTNPDGMKEL